MKQRLRLGQFRVADATRNCPAGSWRLGPGHLVGAVLLALGLGCLSAAAGGTVVQTIPLRAGWNAIHVEVEPLEPATGAIFRNAPIDSVWTYGGRLSAVDFIQDPDEPVWNRNQWLVYLPTNRVESFQNNLFQLQANRAYLIKATASHTLTLEGRPVLPQEVWVPDAYNLRGFPMDPVTRRPCWISFVTRPPTM